VITYQVEQYADVINEITPMFHAHYLEIATDIEVKPLDPDFDRYQTLEDQGYLRIFTVRDQDHDNKRLRDEADADDPDWPTAYEESERLTQGKLIGYFVSIVMTHLHYQQTTMGLNDIMYVDPGYRGSTVGYRMMKLAKVDLKNIGVDILIIHMKCAYPFRPLLKKLGFHLTEENWECVL